MNLHIRFRLSLVHLIKIDTTENINNKLEEDEDGDYEISKH